MTYPTLAGDDSTSLAAPVTLFAGEAPITTNRAEVGTALDLAQYTVIAIVANKIVAYNPAGVDGSEKAAGILAVAANSTTVPGTWAPYYTGGDFNAAALVWPAATDTLAERRAAFAATSTIKISTVL